MMAATMVPFRSPSPLGLRFAPRQEDRWLAGLSRRNARKLTVAVLLASLVGHGLFLVLTLDDSSVRRQTHQEIAIDLVSEIPQQTAAKGSEQGEKGSDNAANKGASKPSTATPAPEKKPEPAKEKEAKAEQPKPEPPKDEPKRPEPPAPAKAPAPDPPKQPEVSKQQAAQSDLKSLESELAALKAEQADLKSQAVARPASPTAEAPRSAVADKMAALGIGEMSSRQAVALPGEGDDGELVSYDSIVFSQLAKAKRIGREMGLPGTTAIRFEVDDQGRLVRLEVATSSGIKKLDDEALAIVTRAAPFPPPPQGARHSFSANVSFIAEQRK